MYSLSSTNPNRNCYMEDGYYKPGSSSVTIKCIPNKEIVFPSIHTGMSVSELKCATQMRLRTNTVYISSSILQRNNNERRLTPVFVDLSTRHNPDIPYRERFNNSNIDYLDSAYTCSHLQNNELPVNSFHTKFESEAAINLNNNNPSLPFNLQKSMPFDVLNF